jgi:hypothetical protein
LKAAVPFLCKEKAPKETQRGSMACAVLPLFLLEFLFFLFFEREKSGKKNEKDISHFHRIYAKFGR